MNSDPNYFSTVVNGIFAIAGAIIGAVVGWYLTTRSKDEKDKKIDFSTEENKQLQIELEKKNEQLEKIGDTLSKQILIESHRQHVLLCGPRGVGKTSLLRRLHSPWRRERPEATDVVGKIAEVPVIKFDLDEMINHPALTSIRVKARKDISLIIHDFAGEPIVQERIIDVLTEETTRSPYGAVLICMFNASELHDISDETRQYYNGDLFKRLRMLQSVHISIVRIVLVFNKFDLLKSLFPEKSINELIEDCCKNFAPLLSPIHGAVDNEKVCAIASILEATNKENEDMGASLIRGEASRSIVNTISPSRLSSVVTETPRNVDLTYFDQQ